MDEKQEERDIADIIWNRDIADAVDRIESGDDFSVYAFENWSPADWHNFAARLAREGLRAVFDSLPGRILIIENDADSCPSATIIGPRDDQASDSRFVEYACADCDADGRYVKLVLQRIDPVILLCVPCMARRAKCDQTHALIRTGGIPQGARFVGLQEQIDGAFPLRLFACPFCTTTVAYQTRCDDRALMDPATGAFPRMQVG